MNRWGRKKSLPDQRIWCPQREEVPSVRGKREAGEIPERCRHCVPERCADHREPGRAHARRWKPGDLPVRGISKDREQNGRCAGVFCRLVRMLCGSRSCFLSAAACVSFRWRSSGRKKYEDTALRNEGEVCVFFGNALIYRAAEAAFFSVPEFGREKSCIPAGRDTRYPFSGVVQ